MKKKRILRKALSVLLAFTLVVGTISICLPYLKLDTRAAGTITTADGAETITQERVVTDYETIYSNYSTYYLNGAGEATDIVIPGLNASQDYVIQGMAYYPAKDWMVVTAYHNDETNSSKMFCLDAATGEFVAMFSFLNTDGTTNLDHGGGIAFSENNIYYSCGDDDRSIAYAPLSELDDIEVGEHKVIQLVDEIEMYEVGSVTSDSKTAYTAYVCYDEGYLWLGNFYDIGTEILGIQIAADYNVGATSQFNSMVYGYKLEGSTSEEEWNYLKGIYVNRLNVTTASGTGTANGSTHIWNASQNGESINIVGSISAPTAYTGEFTATYGSATLTEGETYKIEFDSTNDKTDMYMFSPAGTHCNVKQSSASTITANADGTYHYCMTFTAGLKPDGADSGWPTTQSTDGTYTGTYTVRFDQDAIQSGETRDYKITNARISIAKDGSYSYEAGCRGTPSQAIALENNINDVQYAVAHNGKLYLSCSYGSGAGNSVSFGFGETSKLIVADIDLSRTPDTDVTISTSSDNSTTKTIKAHYINDYDTYDMMPMSEGLCVINDLIFMTFEGASNKYLNESSGVTSIGNCEKPVDVIWKIDPYALKNNVKVYDESSIYYEKVNTLSEIESGEEYIIVYESPVKDPVTQKNILYAIDANGGYHDYKLSKSSADTLSGYTGAIAHTITEYQVEDGKLYLSNVEKDDVRNIRWNLTNLTNSPSDGNDAFTIKNNEFYFVNYPNFYCDASTISMATNNVVGQNMYIQESGDGAGGFWISNNNTYYLWCNDGTTDSYNNAYNNFYSSSTVSMYSGVTEQAGTFHTDALNLSGSNVLGGAVVTGGDSYYAHGLFNIYKRVKDEVASTYESRVYTDMKAELQSDGTYTIDLETYAISPNHYEYVGERPTDYVIVMDASTSVTDSTDGTGIVEYGESNELTVSSLCQTTNTSDENGTGVVGYGFTNPEKQIYYKADDGNYYRIYIAVNTIEISKFIGIITGVTQYYWAYFIDADGMYNVLMSNNENGVGTAPVKMTKAEFVANVDAGTARSGKSSDPQNTDRQATAIYIGYHYEFLPSATDTPLVTIKDKAAELVDEIVADGTDNRIAVTHYGASSYYLNTSNTWATSGFTDSFWDASSTNAETIKTQIASIASSGNQTDNTGIELAFADNIISGSGVDYTADGSRNVCVIFMSDGIPGDYSATDTTGAANNVITKAHTIKDKGAFIYTVVLGADDDNFDKNTFMQAVSSRYPAANSMTDLGGRNIDGVEYCSTLADCTIDGYINFASHLCGETVKNDSVGLANLDASAILCEELSTAFKGIIDENGNLADGITVTYSLVPGSFDKVDRFSFDEASTVTGSATGLTVSYDAAESRRLLISGYDYSEQYISKNKTGNKLQIRLVGVEANEDADITNTSINDTSTTAIYQTESEYSSGETFKYFPTEYFNIPTYTYVLDYDLPMYDNDINGTLLSVDGGLYKQSTYKDARETDNVALNFTNGNLDMTYELVSGAYSEEDNRSFCLIQRDDGTYDWFRINIVPASNVLYEENRFTASTAGSLTKSNWNSDGSAIATYQTLSGDDDRYGYDSAYASNGDGYSNGTALKATVNSSTKRSETMTFSYSGTGFDLMAVCGATTGIQMVTIKNSAGTIEKVYMVDTYYVDTENYDGALLKQVPIVNHTNAGGYGDYTVEVTAAYLSTAQGVTGARSSILSDLFDSSYTADEFLKDMGVPASAVEYVWFNDNSILNGGTGPAASASASSSRATAASDVELDCYIDGIRVYNPLGDDSSLYIDSEKGASYYNIVNELASGEGDVITSDSGLFAYVVGELEADEEGNVPTLSFGNYQSVGPQNEIYLQSTDSHAVAFNVTLPNSDSRVMISLRAVDGSTTAKVASGANSIEFAINTATEQYFDITPYLDVDTSTGVANVIVTNSGSGLLSVNNIKLVDASASVVSSEDLLLMATSLSLTPVTVEPNSYDYDAIVVEDAQPEVDDNTGNDDTGVDNDPIIDVPVVTESIFDKIIAFFKNLFSSIFNIF